MKLPRRLLHYTLFILHSTLAVLCTAQERTDNRRLFWTGSGGMEWSGASWMASGSYLTYVNASASSPVWADTDALTGISFLAGDVAIFDSASDVTASGAPADTRTINIAPGGVTASDIILSGAGSFVFTGGAITTDAGEVLPGSVQLSGTGSGMASVNVLPAGRLVKLNTGDLTFSNTVANVFKGGIHIAAGSLTITDTRALGNNNISVLLSSTAVANNIYLPATVTSANGALLRAGTALLGAVTLRVPGSAAGLDITGDIFLDNQTMTFDIEGDTLVSGRIYGRSNAAGSSGGTIVKIGSGTLTLSGTNNWFYGANRIEAGRVVATTSYAIGTGAWTITPGTTLEFRGVTGTMKQSFIGGGDIEITQGSDIAFSWRNGTIDDYESVGSATQPANNFLGTITVRGASRFSAIATGTYSSVLGGVGSQVFITEGSTLVLGRTGISSRGTGKTGLPVTYPINAMRASFSGASTLVLNPNAFFNVGTLEFSENSSITFGAAGVSQLRWQAGTTSGDFNYLLSDGMKLIVNEIAVSSGYHREFVVVNQGANPLNDIAMTIGTLDTLHDTLSARLADNFLDPVSSLTPARRRKWVNSSWVRYIASQFDHDAVSIATPGITSRINGGVVGLDGILPGRNLLGIYAGATQNNLETTNNTSLASKQRFLGLNAAQRSGKFYVAADIVTGRARTDSLRNEPASLVRGKWDTSYYSGAIQFGAILTPWRKTTLKPYAGLRYSRIKISGYYERGPSPLLVEDFTDTNAQLIYGLAAGRKFAVFKRDLAIDLTLGRKQSIRAPRSTLDTRYLDSPATPIALERGDYYSDVTAFGLSLRWAVSRHTLIGIAGDYETASSHTRSTVTALVGYNW